METENKGTCLAWVHAAYHKFKNRLQNFSRMVNLKPEITQILLGNQHAREGVELVRQLYLLSFLFKLCPQINQMLVINGPSQLDFRMLMLL